MLALVSDLISSLFTTDGLPDRIIFVRPYPSQRIKLGAVFAKDKHGYWVNHTNTAIMAHAVKRLIRRGYVKDRERVNYVKNSGGRFMGSDNRFVSS